MNPRLKALHDQLQALITESQALAAKQDLNDTETQRVEELTGELRAKKAEIARAKAFDEEIAETDTFLNGRGNLAALGSAVRAGGSDVDGKFDEFRKMRSKARFFALTTESKVEAQKKAYRFGMFLMASLTGNGKAVRYCRENGIPLATAGNMNEGSNEDGGALVPAEFESDLIDLREQYGLFRTFARYTPMASETKSRPRRKGGLTAYFVGGGDSGTTSKGKWDRVQLVAKKLMVLAIYESELGEDSIMDMGDTLAGEIAYAFAKKEDACGFLGDGTSTYGGITGIAAKLLAVDGTIANVQGLVVASGNLFSEFTLPDFNKVVGRLPEYADNPNTGWFCHRTFYFEVVQKLQMAAGGVTAAEIAIGQRNRVFMGYPVHVTQTMPKTDANSQVACLFGDLSLASMFGDRRGTTIAMSEHAEFDSDELAVRGTERFDINVHDVGDTTDAGPIIGLISAAS